MAVVNIKPNLLSATVRVYPGDENLTTNDVEQLLAKSGVVFGIDDDAVKTLVQHCADNNLPFEIVIAAGKPAVEGVDGYIKIHIEDKRNPRGRKKTDGAIDYREWGSFTEVKKDDLIAEMIPAIEGQAGKNIKGELIEPKSAAPAPKFVKGSGTRVAAGGKELRASRDGDLQQNANQFAVLDVLSFSANIDYYTGNIDAHTSLRIAKDIMPKFKVRSKGNISVGGSVENAEINCEGSLKVRGGIINHSRVQIRGDLEVGFCNSSYIEASGNIVIHSEVIHSTIVAGGDILIRGKGSFIGGRLQAKGSVQLAKVSHRGERETLIAAGVDPFAELKKAQAKTRLGRKRSLSKKIQNLKKMASGDKKAALDNFLGGTTDKNEDQKDSMDASLEERREMKNQTITVNQYLGGHVLLEIATIRRLNAKSKEGKTTFFLNPETNRIEVKEKGK